MDIRRIKWAINNRTSKVRLGVWEECQGDGVRVRARRKGEVRGKVGVWIGRWARWGGYRAVD